MSIIGKLQFMLKPLSFYFITGVIILISTCFEIHRFLGFKSYASKITTGEHTVTVGNVTTYVYEYREKFGVEFTTFYWSDDYARWVTAESLFKDVFVLVVIFVLNFLIVLKMKQTTKRRVALAGGNAHKESTMSATALKSVINAQKAEKKRIRMILLTGLNYGVFNIGLAINIIQKYLFTQPDSEFWNCYDTVTAWLSYINSINSIIFYYCFNTHFKKFVHHDFKLLFGKLVASSKLGESKDASFENRSSSMATTTQ